ncbi:MAG: SRPBCC family protein [Solirubrobacterales bacterium]
MEFTEKAVIQRPVEEIFAYMSNAENDKEWRPNVIEIEQVSPGEHGVGTEYRQVVKGPMGKALDADLRYTAFEPNKRLAFDTITGGVRPSGVIEFTALSPTSTEVQITLTWEPKGGARMGAPIVGRMLESSLKESYENLPKHLESR